MNSVIDLVLAFKEEISENPKDQHADKIFGILRPQLGRFRKRLYSFVDFEDYEMEVLEAVFEGLESFQGETDGEFYTWFNIIAFRKAVNLNRKRLRYRNFIVPLTSEETEIILNEVAKIDPPNLVLKMDLDDALKELYRRKPYCRDVLWNHIGRNVKQVELARILGLQPATVRMRINRCLDKIAEIYGRPE